MRWFKHLTDASDDPFIHSLEARYGLEGYARWWKLCEAIGRRLKKDDTHASVSLPWSVWQTFLKGKRNQLRMFLESLQNDGRITFKENGDVLEISLPKLLKFRDEYARKSGHTPVEGPDTTSDRLPVQNTETETDTKKVKNILRPSRKRPDGFEADSSEFRAAVYLAGKIRTNKPDAKLPKNLQPWAREFDLMFRVDERKTDQVRRVIDFSQADSFWRANILSARKLREKFDTLEAQMQRGASKQTSQPPRTKLIERAPLQDD